MPQSVPQWRSAIPRSGPEAQSAVWPGAENRTDKTGSPAESGARVIPVYNRFWKFPHRYELAIGEPMHIDSLPPEDIKSPWLHAQADRIRDAVAALEKRFEG